MEKLSSAKSVPGAQKAGLGPNPSEIHKAF